MAIAAYLTVHAKIRLIKLGYHMGADLSTAPGHFRAEAGDGPGGIFTQNLQTAQETALCRGPEMNIIGAEENKAERGCSNNGICG